MSESNGNGKSNGKTRKPANRRGRRRRFAMNDRQVKVSRLYLKGWPQRRIAEELGTSQTSVSHDLREIEAIWRMESVRHLNKRKSEELARLDHIEQTAWEQYDRSLRDAVTTQEKATDDGNETTVTRKGQAGDINCLRLILSCHERRCKLLGLDAPDKLQVGGQIEHMTRDQVTKALTQRLFQLRGCEPSTN